MTANQRIYAAALKYKGVCEVPGPKSNKLIQGWIKEAATWLDDDDSKTPWCGCFRGDIGFETGTGVPAAHYRARNWLQWGIEINVKKPELWQQGDTLIMERSGGAHVTLLDSLTSGKVFANCLGGNQSDKVCIAAYGINRIIGIRRAPDL